MTIPRLRSSLASLFLNALLGGAVLAQTTQTAQTTPNAPPAELTASAMSGLRLKVLTSSPASLNLAPSKDYPRVYGVVMDWPVDDTTATVLAMSTGDASLYTTSGSGVLGGFDHERVRAAATTFVKGAERHIDASKPATSYPYPPAGRVFFYLLTFEGVRLIQADRASVEAGAGPMTELFELGQTVLTELRVIAEGAEGAEGAEKKP